MPANSIALTRLLMDERPSLLRFVQRIVGNGPAAEDVAQHLWLRIHGVEDHPPITNKRAFLYRLAANLAIDHARAGHRRAALFESGDVPENVADTHPAADVRLIDQQRLKRLEVAIAGLPTRCREVFVLRRVEGLAADEVADRLGITINAVAKHVRIALRHCHAAMQETGLD